jgi:myo-inositol-1(or 4)-monophosphatase
LSPWDIAAGKILIEEARGRVSNFEDQPLSIYTKRVLASNGLVHEAMMRVLREGV